MSEIDLLRKIKKISDRSAVADFVKLPFVTIRNNGVVLKIQYRHGT